MLGLADIDGVLRGKYVSAEKLAGLAQDGGGFCDCVFGWDVDDQLYDNVTATGWHTGFPDADYRLVGASERHLPDSGTPYFIGEFAAAAGRDHPLCPRTRLRKVLDELEADGLAVKSGFEYEFFVFDEDPHSVREKGYRDLRPISPGNFGYSVLRAAAQASWFEGLMQFCSDFRMPIEGLHCETGAGVWEAALAATDGLEAADRAVLFKTFTKSFLQTRGLMATFMAKWSMDFPGQSGHFHFSLLRGDENAFAGDDVPDAARWAIGGLVSFLPDFLPMVAPTINSYARLVKGAWAPTAATWGIENRTAAIRFIPGKGGKQHIECRVPGADANPYLVATAVLAAAHRGIREKIEPPPPIEGDAYAAEDGLPRELHFAPTLRDATRRFRHAASATTAFGTEFVDHFANSRDWESREAERHVTDWQLQRYFEII